LAAADHHMARGGAKGSLPPQQSYPVSDYAPAQQGNWRDTNDLQPASVVEGTTRLLSEEERSQ
jgi:hypothetical protein